MQEFKQEFINVAYSEFGIKSIESIDFKQAFAILDKMQQLRIHGVVNCKHENYTPYYGKKM